MENSTFIYGGLFGALEISHDSRRGYFLSFFKRGRAMDGRFSNCSKFLRRKRSPRCDDTPPSKIANVVRCTNKDQEDKDIKQQKRKRPCIGSIFAGFPLSRESSKGTIKRKIAKMFHVDLSNKPMKD